MVAHPGERGAGRGEVVALGVQVGVRRGAGTVVGGWCVGTRYHAE